MGGDSSSTRETSVSDAYFIHKLFLNDLPLNVYFEGSILLGRDQGFLEDSFLLFLSMTGSIYVFKEKYTDL